MLGLGLAALGGASVVLTDPNLPVNFSKEDAGTSLEWLQANVDENRAAIEAAGGRVSAHELEWSSEAHASALRAAVGGDGFDLVVGSELLYDPDNYGPLARVLGEFTRGPAPVLAALGYTHRHAGEGRFLQLASERGFDLESRRFESGDGLPSWTLTQLMPGASPPA